MTAVMGDEPRKASELEQIKYALDQSAIVAVTDVAGRITYANDRFCEISQYSRDELIGQDHRIVNSGHHPKTFMRNLWQTIARGHVWRGELRNRAQDGSIYWVDTTIVPFVNDTGHPWQYMAIRYDITARKRDEEQLERQAALAALGQLAAVVAHEVRNPLAGIRGGAQLVRDLVGADAEAVDLLNDMIGRIDSLNHVVEDILTYARVRELRLRRVDVRELMTDLAQSFQFDPGCAGVKMVIEVEGAPAVIADLDQLRIVFNNLIANACQAMRGWGRIVLRAAKIEDRVIITVTDTGPGLPDDITARLFEPFYTTKPAGTGLGLPTARRFIETHGGGLELLNGPHGGAVARVTLPSAD